MSHCLVIRTHRNILRYIAFLAAAPREGAAAPNQYDLSEVLGCQMSARVSLKCS